MDRLTFTTIAHATHAFCSPVSPANFDRLVARAGLRPGDRVLDLGCGKGEMLLRLAREAGVGGVGVDVNPTFLEQGRLAAAAAGLGPEIVEFRCQSAAATLAEGHRYDLVLCVGSTHALGGYPAILTALHQIIVRGGHALLGEGFWQQTPAPEYLAFLGAQPSDYQSHAGNLATATAAGWQTVDAAVSTPADWDDYEDRYAANVQRYVAAHPDDPDSPALLARIQTWRDHYLRHGRATLGFALYLLRRPG